MLSTLHRIGMSAAKHDEVCGRKPILVEQMRVRLVVAIEHLLRSEIISNKIHPHITAEKCVELMLTEAT